MSSCTYYQILGISKDATQEEITAAKNALAKVYHPDANIHNNIDTTAHMQEILEAYQVLSDPKKRNEDDRKLNIRHGRDFHIITLKEQEAEEEDPDSFVTYWNAASKLIEIVERSSALLKHNTRRESLPHRILKKLGKADPKEEERKRQLNELSTQALKYITLLKAAEIPMEYWMPEAMNWVLVRWGMHQNANFYTLFVQYETFVEQNMSGKERARARSQSRQFQHNLKKLLAYAL